MPRLFTKLLQGYFLALVALIPALICTSIAAAAPAQTFAVNARIGDGKNGRVWNQWRQGVQQQVVSHVTAQVQKVQGGSDTFINLRFGDGPALENGRQVFLPNNQSTSVRWNINQASGGQPLVLNAYQGEVQIHTVTVHYHVGSIGAGPGQQQSGQQWGQQQWGQQQGGHGGQYNQNQGYGSPQQGPGSSIGGSYGGDASTTELCQRGNFQYPQVELQKVKPSGGMFSGQYRVTGFVSGACVQEAGYYEEGRLKERFNLPFSARFQRHEFNLKVRSGRGGEIRAYTSTGAEARVSIDDAVLNSRSAPSSGGGLFP